MKYNKKIIHHLIAFLLILSSSACSRPEGSLQDLPFNINQRDVKVYFTKPKSKEEIAFVSVARKISKDDSVIDGSLRELFLGPTKKEELRGIMTEIPTGTRLIKVEESEDEIVIDVSGQYVTGGGSATMQLRYLQLYKTLNHIAPDKKVYLLVDGKNLKTLGGEGLEITQPLTKINDYTKINKKTGSVQP